jgi:hypothetical protein
MPKLEEGWFTEGFDTLNLKEAKALLDEFAALACQHGRGRLPRSSTTACGHYGFSFSATASIFQQKKEAADWKFTWCGFDRYGWPDCVRLARCQWLYTCCGHRGEFGAEGTSRFHLIATQVGNSRWFRAPATNLAKVRRGIPLPSWRQFLVRAKFLFAQSLVRTQFFFALSSSSH